MLVRRNNANTTLPHLETPGKLRGLTFQGDVECVIMVQDVLDTVIRTAEAGCGL